jgi:hypothetical protein
MIICSSFDKLKNERYHKDQDERQYDILSVRGESVYHERVGRTHLTYPGNLWNSDTKIESDIS